MRTKILAITLVAIIIGCTSVKHSLITNESMKSAKCYDDIKFGIEKIIKEHGIDYKVTSKDMGQIKQDGGVIISTQTTDISEYNGKTFYFIINDPNEPKITLFKIENGNSTKTNTTMNGIKSEKLTNCKCVIK